MSKLRYFGRKCAALAATAATFGSNTVAALFPKGSNTVATHHCTLHWLLSRLQMPFNGGVGSNSSNTFPNFAQTYEKDGLLYCAEYHDPYDADDFDHEDFDEWFENWEEAHGISWEDRAVDEAIDEERFTGDIGDIPF